jgi:hypothetical protein
MSTDTKEIIDDLNVVEETDGSVTVDLPDHLANLSEDGGPDGSQDSDGDVDHPDDTAAVREARRNRRRAKKDYIKRTNEEKDQRLGLMQRRNQELEDRLAVLERKTHGADMARYEKAMEDEDYRMRYAQQKMEEATSNSDGAAFTKAQELWYDSRRKLEAMNNYKEQVARASSQESAPANPKLVRLANGWMERNSWYDPDAGDEDTQIAKVIDNRLVAEGWDPATQDYWDELDNRLQKRLPHRYTRNTDEPSRRSPRSVVTGSSRESSGRVNGNQFVLEPEQVRAMKDAGFWDDPEKRSRMIKRYAIEARNKRN